MNNQTLNNRISKGTLTNSGALQIAKRITTAKRRKIICVLFLLLVIRFLEFPFESFCRKIVTITAIFNAVTKERMINPVKAYTKEMALSVQDSELKSTKHQEPG